MLAIASYFSLHAFALPDPPTPVNLQHAGGFAVRAILKALATVGQYLVPLICLAAAAMSAWRSKSHATHTVNTTAHNADGLFQPGSAKSSLGAIWRTPIHPRQESLPRRQRLRRHQQRHTAHQQWHDADRPHHRFALRHFRRRDQEHVRLDFRR